MFRTRLGLITAVLFLLPSISRGQSIVVVDFQIVLPNLTSRYGETTMAAVGSDAQQKIVNALASRYPHWTFAPAVSGQKVNFVTVVKEAQSNTISLTFDARAAPKTWSAIWLEPGDLQAHGFPPPDKMAGEIVRVFRDEILVEHGAAIGDWLKENKPLAMNGRWHGDRNIVFPISFDRHPGLRMATLVVEGQPRTADLPQFLRVRGLNKSEPYPPDSAVHEFDAALLGGVDKRGFDRKELVEPITPQMKSELQQLSLGRVFLIEEGGSDLDVAPEP